MTLGSLAGESADGNTSLPALIDRARSRLAEARTSAEVLEAKAIAESALHYARITRAANETQADCLRMIVRAEMRMANEIDAASERQRQLLVSWRREFTAGPSDPCAVCGRYKSVTHAHHVYPLSWQVKDGNVKANHEHLWLCPTHHALVHRILSDQSRHLDPDISCSEAQRIASFAAQGLAMAGRLQ